MSATAIIMRITQSGWKRGPIMLVSLSKQGLSPHEPQHSFLVHCYIKNNHFLSFLEDEIAQKKKLLERYVSQIYNSSEEVVDVNLYLFADTNVYKILLLVRFGTPAETLEGRLHTGVKLLETVLSAQKDILEKIQLNGELKKTIPVPENNREPNFQQKLDQLLAKNPELHKRHTTSPEAPLVS